MTCNHLILIISLAGTSIGQVAAQEDANSTFGGLVAVKNGVFKRSWVDPDVDFTQYTRVLPGDAHFEFRAVKKISSTTARRSNQSEYYIRKRQYLGEEK